MPRRPSATSDDPFYVDPSIIPKKQAYQWVAVTVMGDNSIAQKFKGWKPVPFRRHAKIFPKVANVKGKIIVQGQMLVCRPRSEVNSHLDANKHTALAMGDQFLKNDFPYISGQIGDKSFAYTGAIPPSEGYEVPKPGIQEVAVQIRLRLTARHVDAAAALRITPEQYGQRVVSMIADGRMEGFLLPVDSADDSAPAYEVFNRVVVEIQKAA